MFGNFKPFINPHTHNPGNLVATFQDPASLFLRNGDFLINKKVTDLFQVFHAQGHEIVPFIPFPEG
ncbi:MAG: hypothetical protein V2I54_03400 [Bacteroidales bacterium]|nr:hypothetical protein [Bacteroidales bacterium]